MLFGTTYSHRHAAYLKLNPIQAFESLLSVGFDSIRLGCYWDEIEKIEGSYDFTTIKSYLDLCEKRNQKVVLTVGMKAPRWPEFFIPSWIQTKSFDSLSPYVDRLMKATISSLKDYSCISHWQVENEPLDPSGPDKLTIPYWLLQKEVALVRSLDPQRSVVITMWGNDLTRRDVCTSAAGLADVMGIDMYYKVFITKKFSHSFYLGPRDSEARMKQYIRSHKKPLWITELQAEPWEADHVSYLASEPQSMNTDHLQKNIERVKLLQPEVIFLWGSEYWLWKYSQGDTSMWETVTHIIKSHTYD
jgi:hypothetical protein